MQFTLLDNGTIHPENRAQLGGEQKYWPAPSPSHIPQPKFQREPVALMELLAPGKHPMLCSYGFIPQMGLPASLPVLQGPYCRGPLTAKRAKPASPAAVNFVDPPRLIRQIP